MSFIYRQAIAVADRFVPAKMAPAWNHAAGPKTIFFWAPTMKWALVIAGIGDIARPAEKLSLFQSSALAATVKIITPSVLLMTRCTVALGLRPRATVHRVIHSTSWVIVLTVAQKGIIWARYSLVIIPKNYNLFFVNLFVGATGIYQLARIYNYRKSHPDYDD